MKKIGVMGTGTMGSGIIQVCAAAGYDVVIRSSKQEYIDGALAKIDKNLTKMVSREKITEEDKAATLGRISGGTTFDVLADCDLIIESSTENMDKKKELFAALDKVCRDDAILATNTSALSITEIAAVTSRPAQVIGMHFFNPVPAMKLVEVVKGIATSDEVKDAVIATTESLKKTPVEVAEAPGFVVNRVLIPMINEAVGILADGVASAEGIDTAMKLGANHPMGPLALGDLIGLDVCLAIMETLFNEYGDPKYRPNPLLRKMVRANKLGMKTGEGFFSYNK
jgi:3-hydroxybutyryl-CoA dehydrogenase